MVSANEQAAPPAEPIVSDLDLPFFDYNEPGLVGEVYHARLAAVREQGWLAQSPLALVVLDHASGEFFLRSKQTAFPGREIADLFGVTGGRLSLRRWRLRRPFHLELNGDIYRRGNGNAGNSLRFDLVFTDHANGGLIQQRVT